MNWEDFKKSKFARPFVVGGSVLVVIGSIFGAVNSIYAPFTTNRVEVSSISYGDINQDDIVMDVSLAELNEATLVKFFEQYELGFWETPIHNQYYAENTDKTLIVRNEWMEGYQNGERYKFGNYVTPEWTWFEADKIKFPILDVKIINNTSKTLVFDNVILEVQSSTPDTRPVLIPGEVYGEDNEELLVMGIKNEGLGKWKKCTLDFSFDSPGKKRYSVEIPYFDNFYKIDLSPYLKAEGVDVEFLQLPNNGKYRSDEFKEKLKKATKHWYKEERVFYDEDSTIYEDMLCEFHAVMDGTFNLMDDKGETRKLNFCYNVTLYVDGRGEGFNPYQKIDFILDADRTNYEVKFPVSISLRPHEPERLLLSIGAREMSTHKFRVRLGNINDVVITTKEVDLNVFMPRWFRPDSILVK